MTIPETNTSNSRKPETSERRWAPRIWLGCNFSGWLRLLIRNRFAVGLPYIYIAVIDTIGSAMNSVLSLVEHAIYSRRIRRVEIQHAPIFLIGHWRSGTTLLHELMVLDKRHAFPTTFQCFSPSNFLVAQHVVGWLLSRVMPTRRPMDNMQAGLDRPQEDEFALALLGVPSPYLTIAFPNRPPQFSEYLTLEAVPPADLARWKAHLLWFLKKVTYRSGQRRLVLKSPPHTCRIKVLLDMFPDAMFVNIVRDPLAVYSSTMKLWRTLYEAHGLQTPTCAGLDEYVLDTFAQMHQQLEATRHLVPAGRLVDVRYEDLVQNPIGQMRRIYEQLQLGDIETVLPAWEEYFRSSAGYQTNQHRLTDEQVTTVQDRWRPYFERYGYRPELAVVT